MQRKMKWLCYQVSSGRMVVMSDLFVMSACSVWYHAVYYAVCLISSLNNVGTQSVATLCRVGLVWQPTLWRCAAGRLAYPVMSCIADADCMALLLCDNALYQVLSTNVFLWINTV